MLDNLKIIGLVVLAVVLTLFGVYRKGESAGEKAEQLKQKRNTEKVKKVSDETERRVNAESDQFIRGRMRDKWTRD